MLNCNSLAARESMCCTQLVSATQSGLNYCDTFTLCVCFELKRIQLLLFFNLSLLNSLDTPCTHHVARLIHYSWETNNILVLVPNTYQAAHHHLICADFLLFGIHGWMYWDRSDTLQHKQSRCRLQWGICMMHCFFFFFFTKTVASVQIWQQPRSLATLHKTTAVLFYVISQWVHCRADD